MSIVSGFSKDGNSPGGAKLLRNGIIAVIVLEIGRAHV